MRSTTMSDLPVFVAASAEHLPEGWTDHAETFRLYALVDSLRAGKQLREPLLEEEPLALDPWVPYTETSLARCREGTSDPVGVLSFGERGASGYAYLCRLSLRVLGVEVSFDTFSVAPTAGIAMDSEDVLLEADGRLERLLKGLQDKQAGDSAPAEETP